jgi:hypothetical protein
MRQFVADAQQMVGPCVFVGVRMAHNRLPPAIAARRINLARRRLMKKSRSVLVGLGMLSFVSLSSASGYLTTLDQGVSVTRYLMHSGGGMTIWVTGISNPDGCGGVDRVHLKGNLLGHDKMVAAVLAASASGKRVGFWSSGCELIPFWGGTQTVPIVADLWVVE